MNQKKNSNKIGWLSSIGGILSSTLGILGASCVVCAPVCGTVCGGILVSMFGVGVASFFYKYNRIFIIIGVVFFVLGIYFIYKRKKQTCVCKDSKIGNVNNDKS